jgi:hypothetical protein
MPSQSPQIETACNASQLQAQKTNLESYRRPLFSWPESAAMVTAIIASSQAFMVQYTDVALIIALSFSFMLWVSTSRELRLAFVIFVYCAIVWIIFISVKFDIYNLQTAVGLIVRMSIGYFLVITLKDRFVSLLFLWVVRLTTISLLLFVLSMVAPQVFSRIYDLAGPFQELMIVNSQDTVTEIGVAGWERYSFIAFTFSPDRLYQNHGFMWEPGAFAMILNFALAMMIASGSYTLDRNKMILIAGIVSSLSSAGLFVFFIVAFYWLSKIRKWGAFLNFQLAIAAVVLANSLTFLLPKVFEEFQMVDEYILNSTKWGLTRYSSFVLDFQDFRDNPLLGRGLYLENRFSGNLPVASHNGFSDFASRFGLLGIVTLCWNIFHSGKAMGDRSIFSGLFLLAVVLVSSWSERFFELPIFFAILFLGISLNNDGVKSSPRWPRGNLFIR